MLIVGKLKLKYLNKLFLVFHAPHLTNNKFLIFESEHL